MAGEDVPKLYCLSDNPDGDFDGAVADPVVVAEALETWRAQVDCSTRFVEIAAKLDITADDSQKKHGSGGGLMWLRETMVGMIEQYARHMGRADLLRERIDGRVGQ
jgi:hypothetical protein